jgi:nitrate/nitrite transporter NarK
LRSTAIDSSDDLRANVGFVNSHMQTDLGSGLFWPIPQGYLGGFFAPATFGYLQQHTGSVSGGLYALGIASLIAAAGFLTRKQRGDDAPGGHPAPRNAH